MVSRSLQREVGRRRLQSGPGRKIHAADLSSNDGHLKRQAALNLRVGMSLSVCIGKWCLVSA